MDSDYSQIELRVLASLSNESKMIEAFNNGVDIHSATACDVFGLEKEQVTDEIRRRAKAVNFGIVYGISDFGLAKQTGITRKEEDFAKDLFPTLLASGETILGVPAEGYWCDIGTPRSYYQCSLDVLDGRLATEPIAPEAGEPDPPPLQNGRVIPCRDRARLMRAASEQFMELGADFSNGLHFTDGAWRIGLRPSAKESSLLLDASSAEAADTAERLIRLMETRLK